MRQKDCTKDELIFVIKRLQMYSLSDGHYIQLALRDVGEERERKKMDEARKIADYAFQKRQEYIDLLAPYEGKRLVDIPDSVFKKADAAMREAKKADRRWNKIMGIGDAKPAGKKRRAAPDG